MKNIIFLCLIVPLAVPAQSWQNICSPGVTFYQHSGGTIQAYRLDSTDLSLLPDTLFLSYYSIRDTLGDCYDTTGGSFLGRVVRKKPGGVFQFCNRRNDTLTLHTIEPTGYSWKFITDLPGNYIEATMAAKILDSVCGTTDSVKVITFQAKDKSGNNINHVLNGKYIKLSKHFGLTRMMDIYYAPASPEMYAMTGKASPAIGMQNLTRNEVYHFDVGDEFHYIDHHYFCSADILYYTIKVILAKEEFPELHQVVYTVEYCQRKDVPGPPFHYYKYDTLIQVYTVASDSSYSDEMPMDFIRGEENTSLYSRSYPDYIGRQSHKTSLGIYYAGGCWNPPFEYSESYIVTAGLGQTRYSYAVVFEFYTSKLVYYKKGDEEWGSPVASGCNILLADECLTRDLSPQIMLFPNPAGDRVTVAAPAGEFQRYFITTMTGQLLRQGDLPATLTVDIQDLPPGIYLFRLEGEQSGKWVTVKLVKE